MRLNFARVVCGSCQLCDNAVEETPLHYGDISADPERITY